MSILLCISDLGLIISGACSVLQGMPELYDEGVDFHFKELAEHVRAHTHTDTDSGGNSMEMSMLPSKESEGSERS